jgi:hypothetical protein
MKLNLVNSLTHNISYTNWIIKVLLTDEKKAVLFMKFKQLKKYFCRFCRNEMCRYSFEK